MGLVEKIIFFSGGYILGTSGYIPPGPLMEWSTEELKFFGYQIVTMENGIIRIGNVNILNIK